MDNKIDLIMSSIQQSCRAGYLLPKERQTLSDLAELHGIDKAELDTVLTRELEKVRKGRLVDLYKVTKQPDAALSDKVVFFKQSRRQFPDMLKLGTLKLKQNHNVSAPAFVPLKGMSGLCLIHNDKAEMACNIIQNVAVRLMLSIPRSLAHITVVDPSSMGADYIGLSGIDSKLLTVIDDEKQVLPFLQGLSRESASFNFNELGSTFADITEYNRTNRSKARPYQLVILSDYQDINDKYILAEIKKVNKLATKTGIFFLFAVEAQRLSGASELLDVFKSNKEEKPNLCIIDIEKKKIIAEGSDEEAFFNNAFDFELDEDLMFTAETILQFNHEFAPNDYPLGAGINNRGDYCVESLNVVVGKMHEKDKIHTIALQQAYDNILCAAKDEKTLESMAIGMLQGMVTKYKRSEINYVFYNCGFIPESLAADNVVCNIHADKMHYLLSLLKHLKREVETRKKQFQEANASDYESYRNVVESPLPRIVFVMGDVDMILDSENMSAVDSVMLLDQLLNEAGLYGIHFILYGKPSANLFKLNLTEHVRYKLFSSLSEEEVMRLGIFATEDNLLHQNQPKCSLIYDGSSGVSTKMELANIDDTALKDALKTFATGETMDTQKVFVDLNDVYPQVCRGVNADTIADSCLSDDIPIGVPRQFATQFATLGHKNVLVVGDDSEGEQSILHSVYSSLKRTRQLSKLIVLDVSGNHPLGLPGMPGVKIYSELNNLPVKEGSVICVLHSESLDMDSVTKLDMLIDQAQRMKAQVILFAKNDIGANALEMTEAAFGTRIALCNAPEGFLSPVHFFANNDLKLPSSPLQAVCEQRDAESGMGINGIWLFNY